MVAETDLVQRLVDEGWTVITDDGFVGTVGPFLQRSLGGELRFRFPTEARHKNLRGVLQGGALMTFADRAMGIAARAAASADRSATAQLNFQFVAAVEIGDMLETTPVAVRVTSRLVFMNAELTVGPKVVGVASGIWKLLAPAVTKS